MSYPNQPPSNQQPPPPPPGYYYPGPAPAQPRPFNYAVSFLVRYVLTFIVLAAVGFLATAALGIGSDAYNTVIGFMQQMGMGYWGEDNQGDRAFIFDPLVSLFFHGVVAVLTIVQVTLAARGRSVR